MADLKVGQRVYYNVYYEQGFWSGVPTNKQNIKKIETITEKENGYVITLDDLDFVFIVDKTGDNFDGIAMVSSYLNSDTPTSQNIARAFVTTDYVVYLHQVVKLLKLKINDATAKDLSYGTGFGMDNFYHYQAVADLQKFLRKIHQTNYQDLYPEDYI